MRPKGFISSNWMTIGISKEYFRNVDRNADKAKYNWDDLTDDLLTVDELKEFLINTEEWRFNGARTRKHIEIED